MTKYLTRGLNRKGNMKCHNCGKKAAFKSTDPFLEELPELRDADDKGDLKEEWWCEECYEERRYDI
jgi:hypothetical protein